MSKTDSVQLNFYSKYNRAKQKQNINSLYHLIGNNVENMKHIEQLTIVMNGSRKGSVNNSPDRVFEQQPTKRSRLSLGKQKISKLFEQSRCKKKIVQPRKKKQQFIDQIFIQRHGPVQKQLTRKKDIGKRQNTKAVDHCNGIDGQITEQTCKTETFGDICINIFQPKQLVLGSYKSRYNFNGQETTNNELRINQKTKYQKSNLLQIPENPWAVIMNRESIIFDNADEGSKLDGESKTESQHLNPFLYSRAMYGQRRPPSDDQINESLPKVNFTPDCFVRQRLQPYPKQSQRNSYIGADIQEARRIHLLIPNQHRQRNERVGQCPDTMKEVEVETSSFKNVFYPEAPSLTSLLQYPAIHSSRKSLGIRHLSTSNHEADLQQDSNDCNLTPLIIVKAQNNQHSNDCNLTPLTIKVQDNQMEPEKKVTSKKLLVTNKLYLNPRLASSTIQSEFIREATPINCDSQKIQNVCKQNIEQKSPSSQLSKVNFKSILQKNKNIKSGSPDNKQYLSPRTDGTKSSLNIKLLMGFFNQN